MLNAATAAITAGNAISAPCVFSGLGKVTDYHNFGRIHQSLRVTPAMEAGLTDRVWSLQEIADLAS